MRWVNTKDRQPDSDDDCKYYLIEVQGFGQVLAMYFDGYWRRDYISIIIEPVVKWLDEEV